MTRARTLSTPQPLSRRRVDTVLTRYARNQRAVSGLLLLTAIVAFLIVGTLIFTPEDVEDTNLRHRNAPPSLEFPFGTDSVGRNVMARAVYGGQVSLAVALLASVVTVAVGAPLGLLAGYYRGWVDSVIMRLAEALLSIPLLFLLLALSRAMRTTFADFDLLGRELSGSVITLILIIGVTGWMPLARLIRASTLSLAAQDYVLAARALGAGHARILWHHILPNTLSLIIVYGSLAAAQAILLESYVSFLGLGIQAPAPSWGNMIQRSVELIDRAPWLWLFPGGLMALTVVSIGWIGDGLRDSL
jgi:peptide/nickel transport system permease protein